MTFHRRPSNTLPPGLPAQGATRAVAAPGQAMERDAPGMRVWITLTQGAQAHVVRHGLHPRLSVLSEHAGRFESMMRPGDRVALSDSAGLDLFVLRRRFVIDARASTLEITLDVAQPL
ncbi:MAG: hypothetical protein AB1698_08200 [Pseudomonadota bacterium]